jgi:hypothetical protein
LIPVLKLSGGGMEKSDVIVMETPDGPVEYAAAGHF